MSQPAGSRYNDTRIEGLDVARALAIFGMVVVHFNLVMTDGTSPSPWSENMLALLDGRPAAIFMILAGIGISIMSRRAIGPAPLSRTLRRRGLFLLACGTLNLMIWEGDILRVYGVSLILAPLLIWRSPKVLRLTSAGSIVLFCLLMACVDYGRHWDWAAMKYHGLWTPAGFVSSLFYDGFRAIFPWSALLVLGMWLGRFDLGHKKVAPRLCIVGALFWSTSCILSLGIRFALAQHPYADLDRENAAVLFGLQSMPPLPLFLINASASAMMVIGACLWLARRFGDKWPLRTLAAVGRMAFTWYVAHIIFGLGGVILLGWLKTPASEALIAATLFMVFASVLSLLVRSAGRNGPLESLLRRIG